MTKKEFDTQDINTIDMFVSKVPDYFAKTEKIYDRVFGNGTIGMDENVRNLQASLLRVEDLLKEADPKGTKIRVDQLSRLGWVVGGAAATYFVVEILKLL